MKLPALLRILVLGCIAALPLRSADPVAEPAGPAPLTPAQIDELLAPIALYPDPLVAIILPASTFPTDIVMAARYLDAKRDPEASDDQPWDDSVKSLARYPDVVKWMDENLEWTRQLGAAFTLQPAAVLTGTQRLRAAAIAAGNLKTTPEQTVIVEKEVVRIVPAQREIIYVPVYDPYWVYRPWPAHTYHHPRSVITFSSGYCTGVWLSYHFNWGSSAIVIVNRPYRSVVWHNYPAWHYPSHTVVHHHHVWHPAPVVVHKVRHDYHRRPVVNVVQPTVNIHVQRNVTRNINREVNITRNVTRDRDIAPNREVNRNVNAAPSPAPRREIAARTPDDFRRQTRPENRDLNREVVRRPVTNAPDPVRTPASVSPRERTERTTEDRMQRVLRAPAPAAPENRSVLASPRPVAPRPASSPEAAFNRVREPRQLPAVSAPTTAPTTVRTRPSPASAPEFAGTPRPVRSIERPVMQREISGPPTPRVPPSTPSARRDAMPRQSFPARSPQSPAATQPAAE